MFNIYFFENRALYEIMGKKYSRARQTTDDNIVHENCTLYT